MRTPLLACSTAAGVALAAALVAPAAAAPAVASPSAGGIALRPAGTYASGVFAESAAEITSYDPSTQRLFVVNANSGAVDVLDVSRPGAPRRLFTLDTAGLPAADGSTIDEGAVVNSVDVHDGRLAVAVEADPKTDRGWVALFRTRGTAPFQSAVRVGAQPDMVSFSPDGRTVLSANEAEPADDFSSDPPGSVSLVTVPRGYTPLEQSDVRTARFNAWDHGRTLPAGVRVFGPDVPAPRGHAGRVARNLEPEYLTVGPHGNRAYVTLQEANAVGVLDLRTATFTDLLPLGGQDYRRRGVEIGRAHV